MRLFIVMVILVLLDHFDVKPEATSVTLIAIAFVIAFVQDVTEITRSNSK